MREPASELCVLLESHKLSPGKWLTHFNEICISQPEDLKGHKGSTETYKTLLHYSTTDEEKLSIQHLLSISDEKLNRENPSSSHTEDKQKEFNEFLEILGLTDQLITVKDAMLLRKETLDNIRYTNQTKILPYLILQKIFMFDSRSRAALFRQTDKSSCVQNIHPLDSLIALLHSCDNFLRQELLLKLSVCQMAIPILLPNPHDGSVTFLLWAMRLIIKSWKSFNSSKGTIESKEYRIIEYPAPVISFLKFGKPKKSKSNIINKVISESKEDFFFNWNSEGGTSKRLFVDGLCEMCCYLPSGKSKIDDFHSDILLFLNLRGDAQKHVKQTRFIKKISYMIFLLLNEDDINEKSLQLLAKLSKCPGGVVLMLPDLENGQSFKEKELELYSLSGIPIIKLAGKNDAEIRNEIRDIMLPQLQLPIVKKCKSLNECMDIAHKLKILVDENNEECMKGNSLALSLIEKVKLVDITKAKAQMLPLQGPDLWHAWANLDKESFRQLCREDTDMKSYSRQKDAEKKVIRNKQCQLSETLTP